MILTMAYLVLIAVLLGLAADVGERICVGLGWPRRFAWFLALAASLALPVLMHVAGSSTPTTATPMLSLPPLFDELGVIEGAVEGAIETAGVGAAEAPSPAFHWPDWQAFDATLTALWIASTAAVLLLYLIGGWHVHRMTGNGESVTIQGQPVLLSDRLGPAVVGFFKPRIVLPRWLAEADPALQSQVLCHEREHVAAHDQLALLAALLAVASMPWNLALWWQLRRLRAAIEFDCDSRVLRGGADARDYSQALLSVGRRQPRTPFAAVSLTEPLTELERRIRSMLETNRGLSLAGIGARAAVVVSVLTVALAVNAPKAQQPGQIPYSENDVRLMLQEPVHVRAEIQDRLSEARDCAAERDPEGFDCARRLLDEARELPGLETFESFYLLELDAQLGLGEGDVARAIAAYEAIVNLPDDELSGMAGALATEAARSLAELYLDQYRYAEAIAIYDHWLAATADDPSAEDINLRAQMLYKAGNLGAAIAETERAIAALDSPPAHWHEQLHALQLAAGDQAGATRTREILAVRWPDSERISLGTLGEVDVQSIRFSEVGSDYLPLVRPDPVYPVRALQRRYEGYVVVTYKVTSAGETTDWVVTESSSTLFERAAIEAAREYQYPPLRVDGRPVEVLDVVARIDFVLPEEG